VTVETEEKAAVAERRPTASSPAVRARMRRQATRNTSVELAVRRALYARGLRYRVHQRPLTGLPRVADVVFSKVRVAVFVDGCFWHACPEHATWPRSNAEWWRNKLERTRSRDAETDDLLSEAGWIPVRIWEHEEPVQAATRLATLVTLRSSELRQSNAERSRAPKA
jgi:DNA mismatch endonuclease (patch repair protein)